MLHLLKQDRQQVTQVLVTSEEAASSNEASLDRTAVANQVAPATEEHTRQSEPTVPVASPAATNREAAPQSAPTSEAPATSQDLAKVTGSAPLQRIRPLKS